MADSSQPVRVQKLRGKVTRGTFGKGTKSEHDALFVETTEGRLALRRKGGPAYADPALEQYCGREIECDGFRVGTTMLAERITIVE